MKRKLMKSWKKFWSVDCVKQLAFISGFGMYDVDVCSIRRHLGSSIVCLKSLLLKFTRRSSCRSKSRVQVLILVFPTTWQARVLLNILGRNLQLQHLSVTSWRMVLLIASATQRRTFPIVIQVRAPLSILESHWQVFCNASTAHILRLKIWTRMQVQVLLKYGFLFD